VIVSPWGGAEVVDRNLDQDGPEAVGIVDPHLDQSPGLGRGFPDDRYSARGQPVAPRVGADAGQAQQASRAKTHEAQEPSRGEFDGTPNQHQTKDQRRQISPDRARRPQT
jgi:hypothetical protein